MEVGKELKRQRQGRGLSLRQLEKLSGVRYVTINEIELGKSKNGPLLSTLRRIVEEGKLDAHAMAHASYDLPRPGEMDELEGDLKELCDLVMSMSEEERANLLASIKRYISSKDNLFSFDKVSEPKSKYRGGDTLQAPPVAKAGGG